MKRLIPLAFLAVLLVPGASAQSSHNVDYYGDTFTNSALLSASQLDIYVSYPNTVGRVGDVGGITFTADGPTPAVGQSVGYSFDITSSPATGCTATVGNTGGGVSSFGAEVHFTMTDTTCRVSMHLRVFVSSTTLNENWYQATIHTNNPLNDIEDDTNADGSLTVKEITFFEWVPLLFFVAVFLWGGYTRQLLIMLAGVLGVMVNFTGGVPFSDTYPFLLALLVAAALGIRNSWRNTGEEREAAEKET